MATRQPIRTPRWIEKYSNIDLSLDFSANSIEVFIDFLGFTFGVRNSPFLHFRKVPNPSSLIPLQSPWSALSLKIFKNFSALLKAPKKSKLIMTVQKMGNALEKSISKAATEAGLLEIESAEINFDSDINLNLDSS